MGKKCPDCERQLVRREPNFLENIRRREIEDVHDRYVCRGCKTTFSEDEIIDEGERNVGIKNWMDP